MRRIRSQAVQLRHRIEDRSDLRRPQLRLEGVGDAALVVAREAVKVVYVADRSEGVGPHRFATSSHAPEYLMVWQAGNRVAITAIDVDITATSSSSTSQSPALSPSQGTTLGNVRRSSRPRSTSTAAARRSPGRRVVGLAAAGKAWTGPAPGHRIGASGSVRRIRHRRGDGAACPADGGRGRSR